MAIIGTGRMEIDFAPTFCNTNKTMLSSWAFLLDAFLNSHTNVGLQKRHGCGLTTWLLCIDDAALEEIWSRNDIRLVWIQRSGEQSRVKSGCASVYLRAINSVEPLQFKVPR